MKVSTLMWAALIVAVGVSMFLLKYQVQALEEELVAKQSQVTRDKDALRVLEAEWAYFNDPERLRRLSAEHLEFVSPTSNRVQTIAALPYREGLTPSLQDKKNNAVPPLRSVSDNFANERPEESNIELSSNRLSVGPVFFARIQRYLRPADARVFRDFEATP